MATRIVDIAELQPDPQNRRRHNARNIAAIRDSLERTGPARSVVVDENLAILAGNGTVQAAAAAGITKIQIIPAEPDTLVATQVTGLDAADKRYLGIADNRTAELAEWDLEQLLADQAAGLPLDQWEPGELDALLATLPGSPAAPAPERATLADQFIVPPFSVLDARQGYWQDRKRRWLAYGIESELGRAGHPGENGLLGYSEQARSHYGQRRVDRAGKPRPSDSRAIRDHAWQAEHLERPQARVFAQDLMRGEHLLGQPGNVAEPDPQSGTSIFDPVLCELAYRWFCPPNGQVLDPFAGGSVRGIVAGILGRRYLGIDLSARQIAANQTQLERIWPRADVRWIQGDSRELVRSGAADIGADFLFSCPPYGDLEQYSDDPRDLSNMPWDQFLAAYRQIISDSVARLRPDRFACFVVGDIRDPAGNYRNLIGETVSAFQAAGCQLYNESILVTAIGSLPIRVGRQFSQARKLGKTHQNVLVFVRGNARTAAATCGPVQVAFPTGQANPGPIDETGDPQ